MASEFDDLLAEVTKKDDLKIHGVLIKCIDKNGEFYANDYPCSYSFGPRIPEL